MAGASEIREAAVEAFGEVYADPRSVVGALDDVRETLVEGREKPIHPSCFLNKEGLLLGDLADDDLDIRAPKDTGAPQDTGAAQDTGASSIPLLPTAAQSTQQGIAGLLVNLTAARRNGSNARQSELDVREVGGPETSRASVSPLGPEHSGAVGYP
ncbi:hypothetical protein HKX48_009055 [Thoreauomyces humboldtii]|nr:hypothetical protein HKX48_009055 [Thoreauomyces humboldtii]